MEGFTEGSGSKTSKCKGPGVVRDTAGEKTEVYQEGESKWEARSEIKGKPWHVKDTQLFL